MTIEQRVRAMNDAWREGRFDDLLTYFDPDVVLVGPGFEARVTGREAVVDTYRQYSAMATTEELTVGRVSVDQWGDVAVATVPFTIVYVLDGKRYDEAGHEVLVFRRVADEWLIVWRTLSSKEA